MPTPCTAVSPAPEGGTCVFNDCDGPHSFEPRRSEILPSGDVVRVASVLSEAEPLPDPGSAKPRRRRK